MTEYSWHKKWYYKGSTTKFIKLAEDFFKPLGAKFLTYKDLSPSNEVLFVQMKMTHSPGVNESALVFSVEDGKSKGKIQAVREGSGCVIRFENAWLGWDFIEPIWSEFIIELNTPNVKIIPITSYNYENSDQKFSPELYAEMENTIKRRYEFVLDTTTDFFYGWLNPTTFEDIRQKKTIFPTSRGEFLLNPAEYKKKPSKHSLTALIVIRGHEFLLDNDKDITLFGGWDGIDCIRFFLKPGSEKRTFVTAECLFTLVMPYFYKLIVRISQLYPETSDVLNIEMDNNWTISSRPDNNHKKPWNQIPDYRWDRKAVEFLHRGYSSPEIGKKVGVDAKTIDNRLSILRKQYPMHVPTRDELRNKNLE